MRRTNLPNILTSQSFRSGFLHFNFPSNPTPMRLMAIQPCARHESRALLWLKWLVRPVQTDDPAHSLARLTRWRAESTHWPSEHPEVAVVVEDFPREILVL